MLLYLQQYASLGVGVQYYRRQKLWYTVRGKKEFPVTANNSVNFHIKGKYDVDEKLLEVGNYSKCVRSIHE